MLNFHITEQSFSMNQNQLQWHIIYGILKTSCQVQDMHLAEIALSPSTYISWLPVRDTVTE